MLQICRTRSPTLIADVPLLCGLNPCSSHQSDISPAGITNMVSFNVIVIEDHTYSLYTFVISNLLLINLDIKNSHSALSKFQF